MVDYPKNFEPIPETIYAIQMVGGKIPEDKKRSPDDDRYPRPMIFKKQYDKKDGTGKYWGWSVSIFSKEVKYNEDDNPETDDDTLGEYTFWIPEEVREQVDEFFEAGIYKFYLRKKAIWYKDSKGKDRSKGVYQVSAGLSGLKDIQTKAFDVKPTKQKEITEVKVPFDDYMKDDKVASKEDLQGEINRPKEDMKKVNEKMKDLIVDIRNSGIVKCLTDMDKKNELYSTQILGTLQNIEVNLGDIVGTLQLSEKYLEEIATCFTKMLDKFTVKIKKVKE